MTRAPRTESGIRLAQALNEWLALRNEGQAWVEAWALWVDARITDVEEEAMATALEAEAHAVRDG